MAVCGKMGMFPTFQKDAWCGRGGVTPSRGDAAGVERLPTIEAFVCDEGSFAAFAFALSDGTLVTGLTRKPVEVRDNDATLSLLLWGLTTLLSTENPHDDARGEGVTEEFFGGAGERGREDEMEIRE